MSTAPQDDAPDQLALYSRALKKLVDAVEDRFPGIGDPRVGGVSEFSSIAVAWREAKALLESGGNHRA